MRFGIHFMDFTLPGEPGSIATLVAQTAKATEDAGGAWFTAMDHFFQIDRYRTAQDPMLEGYSVLAFVAAHTRRLQLGTLVTGVTYRHPGLLAKTVTTLDVLSQGRAFLGIGAAWYEREHLALGVPYPPLAQRFEMLEEALQITLQMWTPEDEGAYAGKHYRLAETLNYPRNLSTPRPKIVIGGNGERKTMRLVAQYADSVNVTVQEVDEIASRFDALRRHCDDLGRDYSTIEKTALVSAVDSADADAFLAHAEKLAAIGVDHVQIRDKAHDPVGAITRFGEEVAPRLAEIVPAGR